MAKRLYIKGTLAERLAARSQLNPDTGCVEFIGSCRRGGYGQINFDGRIIGAHQAAWIVAKGPIPTGMWTLHKCDNPICINPDHLFLGTNDDNVADKVAKGRQSRIKKPGEKNGRAILTDKQAVEIFQAPGSNRSIADRYGVHLWVVYFIKKRIRWRHVTNSLT